MGALPVASDHLGQQIWLETHQIQTARAVAVEIPGVLLEPEEFLVKTEVLQLIQVATAAPEVVEVAL
jgi:hypothetical protein